MRRYALSVLLTGLALGSASGLMASPAAALEPINQSFFGAVAIEGYDPVAYFEQGEPREGSSERAHAWKGATWHFSSAANRAKFAADPERYAPQYGGYCAYAVSQGATAGIDPQAWTIVDGKLYLNYDKQIQKRWEADRDNYIRLANANWPKLVGG